MCIFCSFHAFPAVNISPSCHHSCTFTQQPRKCICVTILTPVQHKRKPILSCSYAWKIGNLSLKPAFVNARLNIISYSTIYNFSYQSLGFGSSQSLPGCTCLSSDPLEVYSLTRNNGKPFYTLLLLLLLLQVFPVFYFLFNNFSWFAVNSSKLVPL